MTCICILFFFLFGVDWNQEKNAHQLRAKPKPLLAAIIFRAMAAMMLAPNFQCLPTLSFFAPRTGVKVLSLDVCSVRLVLFCSVYMT